MRTLNEHESLSFKDHKATRYGPSPHPFWSGDGRYTNPPPCRPVLHVPFWPFATEHKCGAHVLK
ncbi:hypothetical protein HanPI659440_Chr17g0691441 [Helianthus annuus]|nr:hypothetical protein HanPI659440_Chr17g0691441 [Helianthus annuus]KAJ0814300.1 hypothetical protein HanPSC8_Chr17g0783981 [Helianthus annuus]